MSIKGSNYQLPIVWPENYIRTFGSGANKPILISGTEEANGKHGRYVVKLLCSERLGPKAFLRETLACFIAKELGIPSVEPVIVNINEEFANCTLGEDVYTRIKDSIGINFGSRLLEGHSQTIMPKQALSQTMKSQACDIFVFDMLIQNADRRINKPNLLTDGNQIVTLDHELAFGFLFEIITDKNPWEVTREKWPDFNQLILPDLIKKEFLEPEEYISKLNLLDDVFWLKCDQLIPHKWKVDNQLQEIADHIEKIKSNGHTFVRSLQHLIS